MGRTIPALPVHDMTAAVACYRDKFGFEVQHSDDGFAVLQRDEAILHLWQAADERWKDRSPQQPVQSGAESFLAGTASCRVETDDVDGLYAELSATGVLHCADRGVPTLTDFGSYEFATTDADGNLVEFYRWVQRG